MLSQLSAAVHTRLRMAGQAPLVVSWNTTGTSPMQLSMAVTSAGGGGAHSTVTSTGTPSSTGAVVSTTVILCVQITVFMQ